MVKLNIVKMINVVMHNNFKNYRKNIKNRPIIVSKGNAFYKQKLLASTQYKKRSKLT